MNPAESHSVTALPLHPEDSAKSSKICWPVLAAICLVALGVRAFWAVIVHAVPISDFGYYYWHAHYLLMGAGYTTEGKPTAFWPPGYSLMLFAVFRVFGESVTVAKAAGIVLWTISAALTYLLGLRLGGRLTAAIAGFAVALFPEFILYGNLIASENLFVPLALGAILALSPPRSSRTRQAGSALRWPAYCLASRS